MHFSNIFFWLAFSVIVAIMLWIDLKATDHRKGKMSFKVSLMWTGVWIMVALIFGLAVYTFAEDGHTKAVQFLSAYIVEKSLSVDNLFVFLMIFNIMGVKDTQQPHVLKWGILSAVVMRVIFILAGVALMSIFHPIIYIFGLFLFYAAYKMSFGKDEAVDVENNKILKFAQKRFNLIPDHNITRFFEKVDGKVFITPLFLTLLLVESSDLIFAVDSIPAVLAISTDPFVAITSNIFAILGLRALYFALSGIVDIFKYLKYGVSVILAFVGAKMLLVDFVHIDTETSLFIILGILAASIIMSLIIRKPKHH